VPFHRYPITYIPYIKCMFLISVFHTWASVLSSSLCCVPLAKLYKTSGFKAGTAYLTVCVILWDLRFSWLSYEDGCPLGCCTWWWRQSAHLKCRSMSTRLHGAIFQKTTIFILRCYEINFEYLYTSWYFVIIWNKQIPLTTHLRFLEQI
jgi:hypothetical protein